MNKKICFVGITCFSSSFRTLALKSHLLRRSAAQIRQASSSGYQAARGDSLGGDGIILEPPQTDSVVIWLHGLGDTAQGWYGAMGSLGLPDTTKFILPTAATCPISINAGMPMPGWTDIYGLDANSPEDASGFENSRNRVDRIIEAELNAGVSPDRIAVCGFSQGGALALHVVLRSKLSLGACVACSSWLPLRSEYPAALSQANKGITVLQCHGDEDQVVDITWGQESFNTLRGEDLGLHGNLLWKSYEGMGHSACEEELTDVGNFLKGSICR